STGVIPIDFYGMTCMSGPVREKYLSLADPEKVRAWHSYAADWFVDNDKAGEHEQEKLYHLVKAGRNKEACKLTVRVSEKFTENPNEDLLAILKEMQTVDPKTTEQVYNVRARIALACGDSEYAFACADVLSDYMTNDPDLIRAEAYMISGNAEKGYSLASAQYNKSPSSRAALIAAKCLFKLKKYDEASDYLASAYAQLTSDSNATGIDDILMMRAGIAYDRGKIDESLSYLGKAKMAARKTKAKERIDAFTKNIKSGKKVNFD
ncbi:MAG: CDC27 family protein, partial [Methanomassiliicoccaceae archaeon]|nr:CDC27 family protein [Methanomassiliicoccaceae archaeon]